MKKMLETMSSSSLPSCGWLKGSAFCDDKIRDEVPAAQGHRRQADDSHYGAEAPDLAEPAANRARDLFKDVNTDAFKINSYHILFQDDVLQDHLAQLRTTELIEDPQLHVIGEEADQLQDHVDDLREL